MRNFRKSSPETKLFAAILFAYIIFISFGFYSAITNNFSLLNNGIYDSLFGIEIGKNFQTALSLWTEKTFISLADKGILLSLIGAFLSLNRELKQKNYNFGYLLYFLILVGFSRFLAYSFFGSSLGDTETMLVKSFLILGLIFGGYTFWKPKDKQTRIFYTLALGILGVGLYFFGLLSF